MTISNDKILTPIETDMSNKSINNLNIPCSTAILLDLKRKVKEQTQSNKNLNLQVSSIETKGLTLNILV